MRKPLIVYVSGAPGSGKTTLAEKLSKALYVPHVSSDLVHGGVRLTEGKANDRRKSFHEGFVPLMIQMSKSHISFVVDQVLQKSMSSEHVIDKIKPYATIINIHTKSKDPVKRHLTRELERTDKGVYMTSSELKERAEFHQGNLEETYEPLDFGLARLIVYTDDGYEPEIAKILQFIEENYS